MIRCFGGAIDIHRFNDPKHRAIRFDHFQYDGHFYMLSLWIFAITWSNNPHFYLTQEEIDVNVAAYLAKTEKDKK